LAKTEKRRADQQRRANRLAITFRRDVHQALSAEIASPQQIELRNELSRTSYEVDGNIVTRRQVSEGKTQNQELFELDEKTSAVFEVLSSPDRIQMKVTTGNKVNDFRRIDRNVSAVIGRLPALQLAENS
ncbi:MAG: hypothetical protein ACR2NZ_15735, partial [Rubripirellula sp.]